MPPWLSVSRSELLNEGVSLDYVEMWSETDEGKKARKTKAASRAHLTKRKIKHCKGSVILVNDERSATLSDKAERSEKKR